METPRYITVNAPPAKRPAASAASETLHLDLLHAGLGELRIAVVP